MGLSKFKYLGPGLMLAATAIGVSHLVQSTRAGAEYGLLMIVFIFFGLVTKYPTFLFAQRYSSTTGLSLLEGFRQQGKWALVLVALVSIITMFVALSAISLTTAGLLNASLGLTFPAANTAICLIVCCALLVAIGHYHWLEIIIKVLVVVMSITTIIATALVLCKVNWMASVTAMPVFDLATITFIAALIGWMPVPLDVAIWQSLWTLAKRRDSKEMPSVEQAKFDFNIGYLAAAVLAICFLLLGNGVMFGKGVAFESGATAFALQLIALYEQTLGAWSGPIIGISALMVMLSTMLSITDGYPRAMATLIARFQRTEIADQTGGMEYPRHYYLGVLGFLCVGATIVLLFFMHSFKSMIEISTIISFLTAPIIAFLVYRVITSATMPEHARPCGTMRLYSILSLAALTIFALSYALLLLSF